MNKLILILLVVPLINGLPKMGKVLTENELDAVLKEYDLQAKTFCQANVKANWDVATDTDDAAKKIVQNQRSIEYANFRKEQFDTHFRDLNVNDYSQDQIKRQLSLVKEMGTAILSDEDLTELNRVKGEMTAIYNSAKICPFDDQSCADPNLSLDPEIEMLLAESETYDELEYVWTQWHEKTGKLMRGDYNTYVNLLNKAANANGYEDAGGMWRSRYEDPTLVESVKKLWVEVEPLYRELHTYVKNALNDLYGDKMDPDDKLIPAHLLGNMWAQSWVHLYDRIKPFKDGSSVDVTAKMGEMGYDAKKMFELSDEFYMSMGLPSSNMSYDESKGAVIEKPPQTITCHASAWDFCDGEDFRIKMCTKVNMEDFVTVHHEMGHIMYFILYKDQPLLFRTGANPGFHEAVGDTIALSVSTPTHLQKIGLLENYLDTEADNINALFHMALERVAFLPFGLLIDMWRWDVFSGNVTESEWNSHWWKLREEYQKVKAPSNRDEEFFDPGAKYHVPGDSQYIAYFVAHILEFQFYRSLCIEAGQFDPNNPDQMPLHKCDFYENKAAGEKLAAGLSLGLSKHWTEALESLTGTKEVSAQPILDYFKPLMDYMKKQNGMRKDAQYRPILEEYNVEASIECNKLVKAEWDTATDTRNEAKQAAHAAAVAEFADFSKKQFYENFEGLDEDEFDDETIKRQIKQLNKLGTDILLEADLMNLTNTISHMEVIYNTAVICPFDKQDCDKTVEANVYTLDPEISERMAVSEDFDELAYIWKEWRDASGKNMRDDYKVYVELSNKAAAMNGMSDYGAMWRESYEDENFIENIDKMWSEVEPLYNELHTYVRRKLNKIYGDKMDPESNLIPAHLLGNMWAQSWINLYDRTKPFEDGSSIDITETLKEKGYTAYKMFEESDRFYKALGLEPNDMSYDVSKGAIIEKPEQTITCHASAWDFCDRSDFRVKMCTNINNEDFITVHHEMGHIQYYILYKDLPMVLRSGANPGFHEAVGDLIALSVSTPTHLEKIGLLENYADTESDNINALFKMALERVAFLPFGLLIDKWRWDVFNGNVNEAEWNARWWTYRERYQKISPPFARSESDFDPGAKYHVPANSQYIAYFVAHILQFQLHRAVCIEAGQYVPNDPTKPLHKCDIEGSTEAGAKIRAGLSLGLSKHWSVALEAMTGETELSGSAVLEYFQPLLEFLKAENEKTENDNNGGNGKLIGIIVGSVVGGLVVVGVAGYGFYRYRKNRATNNF